MILNKVDKVEHDCYYEYISQLEVYPMKVNMTMFLLDRKVMCSLKTKLISRERRH